MAAVAMKNERQSFDRYKGDTKNQLRHGDGVYAYENTFFKYVGQWYNGHKHGHGKLLMKDGGYYEGNFENGEIKGHGYRVFGLDGSTYTGQFHEGEFNGYGLLVCKDGSQYEGEWLNNKREGQGILRTSDGSVYEGEFHNHKQHGVGALINSNGNTYEGDWVCGQQHGHGTQRTIDGTVYEGQWKGGVYHGEGTLTHSSGFRYQGMWCNGSPADETVRLLADIKGPIVIEQGHSFSISLTCINDKGEIVQDNGRSFMASCYVDKNVIKRNLPKPSYGALMKEDIVTIPFGDVVSHELLQVPQPVDTAGSESISIATSETKLQTPPSQVSLTVEADKGSGLQFSLLPPNNIDPPQSAPPPDVPTVTKPSKTDPMVNAALKIEGGPETRSMYSMNSKPEAVTSEEKYLSTLVSPIPAVSRSGRIEFKELYIPPPPAPQLEAVIKKATPLLTRTSSMGLSGRTSPRASSPKIPQSLSSPIKSDHSNTSSKKKSPSTPTPSNSTVAKSKKSPIMKNKTEKEKLLHVRREKYCAPGIYIIKVFEVSSPPIFNKLLPPTYIELKVVVPKVSSKETSLDKILNKNRAKNRQHKLS